MHIKNQRKQKKYILKSKKICESAYLKGNVASLFKKNIFFFDLKLNTWLKVMELKIFKNLSEIKKIVWKKTWVLKIIWKFGILEN